MLRIVDVTQLPWEYLNRDQQILPIQSQGSPVNQQLQLFNQPHGPGESLWESGPDLARNSPLLGLNFLDSEPIAPPTPDLLDEMSTGTSAAPESPRIIATKAPRRKRSSSSESVILLINHFMILYQPLSPACPIPLRFLLGENVSTA
jgi:hypothetical protein